MLHYPHTIPKQTVHLHPALDLQASINQEERSILQQYGKMIDGISRDILVPSTMPLRGLHYAIQQLFGWQMGTCTTSNCPIRYFNNWWTTSSNAGVNCAASISVSLPTTQMACTGTTITMDPSSFPPGCAEGTPPI